MADILRHKSWLLFYEAEVKNKKFESMRIEAMKKIYEETLKQHNTAIEEMDKSVIGRKKLRNLVDDKNIYSKYLTDPLTKNKENKIEPGDSFISTEQFKSIPDFGEIFKIAQEDISNIVEICTGFGEETYNIEDICEYMDINNSSKLLIKFEIISRAADPDKLTNIIKEDIYEILERDYNIIVSKDKVEVLKQNELYLISISDMNVITNINNIKVFTKKLLENEEYNRMIKIIGPIIRDNYVINNINIKNLKSLSKPNEKKKDMTLKCFHSPETLGYLNNVTVNFNFNLTVNDSSIKGNNNISVNVNGNDNTTNTNSTSDITNINDANKSINTPIKDKYQSFIDYIKTTKFYESDSITKKELFNQYKIYILGKFNENVKDNFIGLFFKKMSELNFTIGERNKSTCEFIK
jgi:hypothetical protein